MVKIHTIDVRNSDYWELIIALNHYGSDPLLPSSLKKRCMELTWHNQNGYGQIGYTPPQGWDFSGIRDSTEAQQRKIADLLRNLLLQHNITHFVVEKVS